MSDDNSTRENAREAFEHLPHHVDDDGFFHVDGIMVAYVGDPQAVYMSTSGYVELSSKHGFVIAGAVATEAHFLSVGMKRALQ